MELFALALTGVVAAWIPIEIEVGRGGVKAKLDAQTYGADVTRMKDAGGRKSIRLFQIRSIGTPGRKMGS